MTGRDPEVPAFLIALQPAYEAMRWPGEVWFLPPEVRAGGDPKGRRHVLLAACAEADSIGIMAYASTQLTEARHGAANVLLNPSATEYGRRGAMGFLRPTYVYPSRLIPARSQDFQRMAGRLVDEMPDVRLALRHALGLGTGSCADPGVAAGSWRGRIVRLAAEMEQEIGFAYAIIVSDPGYSNAERYQLFVPIDDLGEFEPGQGDVSIPTPGWLAALKGSFDGVLIAVPEVQSAFHPTEIAEWTGAAADEATMRRIDLALVDLFGL